MNLSHRDLGPELSFQSPASTAGFLFKSPPIAKRRRNAKRKRDAKVYRGIELLTLPLHPSSHSLL
jgi:hypothetical protein